VDTLIISYEDSARSTIKPRLMAANADVRRIHRPVARYRGARDLVSLPDDLERIAELAHETGARLLVVDPLSAALAGDVNSHRDQDVRRALAPLAQLAEDADLAVLLLAHFNKAPGGDSLSRVLGSRGITAAVRSVLAFGRAPDAEDGSPDRVLAHPACNLGREAPSLSCRLEPRVVEDELGDIETSRLVILGDCDVKADALLVTRTDDERTDREIAADWLVDELSDGEWHKAGEVKASAKAADIAVRTLQRAHKLLGVEDRRSGFPGPISEWRLPYAPTPAGAYGATKGGAYEKPGIVEPNPGTAEAHTRQVPDSGAYGTHGTDGRASNGDIDPASDEQQDLFDRLSAEADEDDYATRFRRDRATGRWGR
jgi:hypothetical protein